MEIYFRPPSAPGLGPTYSSAASFGHFCLRGDVRSFSNETPVAERKARHSHFPDPGKGFVGIKISFFWGHIAADEQLSV